MGKWSDKQNNRKKKENNKKLNSICEVEMPESSFKHIVNNRLFFYFWQCSPH